jgi:putative transposase
MKPPPDPHYRHQFPAEIISYAVWLYRVFSLSLRDVELLLAERGVVVSYETVRLWCKKFGASFADRLRRHRPRPGDKWHLDGVSRTYLCKEVWRYTRDENGPLDAGSQVQASNRCKPLPLRVVVVSVAANGGTNPIRCVPERRAQANR